MKPNTSIKQLLDAAIAKSNPTDLLLLAGRKTKFNNDEKAIMFNKVQEIGTEWSNLLKEIDRRINRHTCDPDFSITVEPVVETGFITQDGARTPRGEWLQRPNEVEAPHQPAALLTPVPVNKMHVLETGTAFRGNHAHVVRVPITSVPRLHKSRFGKYSWSTKVAGYQDYRYINVSNFCRAEIDPATGQMYAVVDSRWTTDQPVFKDYCNK